MAGIEEGIPPKFPAPEEDREPQPAPEEQLQPETPVEVTPVKTEAVEPEAESRARRFFRRLFRWVVGLLIVFGLGVIAALFLVYRPTAGKLDEMSNQLAQSNQQVAALEDKIGDLESQIEALSVLKNANQELQEGLDQAELHIHILSALANVHAAQFALTLKDVANAQVKLNKTPKTLNELRELIDPGQRQAIDSMVQRLELTIRELESDRFAAQSDLDVLANSLIQLENSYFAAP